MYTIDLTVSEDRLQRSVKRARERNIIVPTFAQMKDPARIPDRFKEELSSIGLWDVHPRNLFRISWHNEAQETGDDFGEVNLSRVAFQLDRSSGPHRRARGEVVPNRCS